MPHDLRAFLATAIPATELLPIPNGCQHISADGRGQFVAAGYRGPVITIRVDVSALIDALFYLIDSLARRMK